MFTGDGLAFWQPPQRRSGEVQFGDNTWKRGSLSTRKGDAGKPAGFGKGGAQSGVNGRVGLRNGDVINERYGFGPHAQKVVDVHRHAVDANTAPLLEHRRDLQFAAHPVGGHGEQVFTEFDEAAKASGQVHRRTGGSRRTDAFGKCTDE